MSEEIKVTPFGTPIRPTVYTELKANQGIIPTFELELDKETGSTRVVEGEPIDLYAQIQSYKDQCGMENAQALIGRGLKDPASYQDTPIDYGDISDMPDNINDAYQANLKASEEAKKLGIGHIQTQEELDAYIKDQVSKSIAAKEAPQKVEEK